MEISFENNLLLALGYEPQDFSAHAFLPVHNLPYSFMDFTEAAQFVEHFFSRPTWTAARFWCEFICFALLLLPLLLLLLLLLVLLLLWRQWTKNLNLSVWIKISGWVCTGKKVDCVLLLRISWFWWRVCVTNSCVSGTKLPAMFVLLYYVCTFLTSYANKPLGLNSMRCSILEMRLVIKLPGTVKFRTFIILALAPEAWSNG